MMKPSIKSLVSTTTILRKLARQVALLVSMMVLLTVSTVPIFAQGNNQESEAQNEMTALSSEEALRKDAEAYAQDYGVAIEEAVHRLRLQAKVNALDEVLQVREETTFAGLWIEHTPQFRVIIRITQIGDDPIDSYIVDKSLATLVDVQTAETSLRELQLSQLEVARILRSANVPFESEISYQENRVLLYIGDKQELLARSLLADELLDVVEVIEQQVRPTEFATWYAGLSLAACTTGFTVKDGNGTRYPTTAYHCYQDSPGNIAPFGPPIGGNNYGEVDFSVHNTPSGGTLKNWAKDIDGGAPTPYYRLITGYFLSPASGSYVCKYGRSTGYTCGTISSNTASYGNHWNLLKIDPSTPGQIIACSGDSGGPVYSGGTALGLVKSGYCGQDGKYYYYATKLKGLYNMGFTVLTTS